jgi:hypothetical protein
MFAQPPSLNQAPVHAVECRELHRSRTWRAIITGLAAEFSTAAKPCDV